jgi:Holliday junction resolvase RusA-like endonuclease
VSTGDLFSTPAAPRVERDAVTIEVLGRPSPKGSMRAFVVGKVNPRAVITAGNDSVGLKLWAGLVAEAARGAMEGRRIYVDTPLIVNITFRMTRPTGHVSKATGLILKSAPTWPAVKPDIDKLARSTLDALTGVVFDDDSRIVSLAATKIWAIGSGVAPPGASIWVKEAV